MVIQLKLKYTSLFNHSKVNLRSYSYFGRTSKRNPLNNRDLPWMQSLNDVYKKEPFINRLVGWFLFKKMLKITKTSFEVKEFTTGVKEAVKVVAAVMREQNHDSLKELVGPALHRQFKIAFEKLQLESKDIYLKVDGLKGLHISGARLVFGDAEPGDEYIMEALGQKIILSKNEIDDLYEEKGGTLTGTDSVKFGKEFGENAFQKRIRFQFDVKFQLNECFKILPNGYSLSEKEKTQFVTSYHKWKLETPFYIQEHQELNYLDWIIVDIDDFLLKKYKTEIIED